MKISPARVAAYEILSKIENERAFSSVLLPLYEPNLSPQDRSLCHGLTLGILRKQVYLDKVIASFTNDKKLDPAVRIAIRIGLFQLLLLDRIPDYSAINESVNLVQYAKKTSAKGFVNAILRRATREKPDLRYSNDLERISTETSHPQWLLEKWIERFGAADAEKLAVSNNELPQIAFRFTTKNALSSTRRTQMKVGPMPGNAQRSEFVEDCFIAKTIDAELLDLADKGEIYFQDEASQMVAASVNLDDGDNFLDVCASPGSKVTLIGTQRTLNSTSLTAGDLYWKRVQFLRDNCRNQGAGFVNVLQYDAERSLPFEDKSFDIVMLDAPCSGTGTIRHNPEIRYFLGPSDFGDLSKKQLALLQNASKVVKSGGRLIYSTCSLETEENEDVCAQFLAMNDRFVNAEPNVHKRFLTSEGFAQTLPHRDNMDGFFVACFNSVDSS